MRNSATGIMKNYGVRVRVEYSCFGTNEDIYNQLTMGDTFDLICPSDYMIMKLMKENALEPYSDEFFDEENGNELLYQRCLCLILNEYSMKMK